MWFPIIAIGLMDGWIDLEPAPDSSWMTNLADVELEEFTGAKDSQDAEIYEGDILNQVRGVFAVEWNDDTCQMQTSDGIALHADDNYGCWREVIGNIHENPELLK